MNRRTILFFVCLALCSMVLFGFLPEGTATLPEAAAVPFLLLAEGLRSLSLSGRAGNAAAIVLYAAISLTPLLGLFRKGRTAEDALLVPASGLLFYLLYGMINPGSLPPIMGSAVGASIHVGGFLSILIIWGFLRLLRRVRNGSLSFYGVLRLVLPLCAGLWIAAGFGLGLLQCKLALLDVRAGNTMPGLNLLPTYGVLIASFLLKAAEYGLDALLLLCGTCLVTALEREPYSEAACETAGTMERLSRISLLVLLFGSLLFNLGQIFLAPVLHEIHVTVQIPLFSLCLMFGIMALSKLLQHGRQLKADNDLFI